MPKPGPFDNFTPAMPADLRHIIDEIANQADDFLDGVTTRDQARAGIAELLTMDFPDLDPAQRAAVTEGVMTILNAEEFFGTEFVGDSFADQDEPEE